MLILCHRYLCGAEMHMPIKKKSKLALSELQNKIADN